MWPKLHFLILPLQDREMDIRNFFGRPQSKPKSDTIKSPAAKEVIVSPSASTNGKLKNERTPEKSKSKNSRSPLVTELKKDKGSPSKNPVPRKRPVHEISSSDEDEAELPKKGSAVKESLSADEFFKKNSTSPGPKSEKRSPQTTQRVMMETVEELLSSNLFDLKRRLEF